MHARLLMAAGSLILASLFTGCNSLQRPTAEAVAAPVQSPNNGQVAVGYPVKNNLNVEVTFQNQRAYDAVQLGLFLLAQTSEDGQVVGIDEPAFFPKYFTLVNTSIDEGLLYISETEALRFAKVAYLQYQQTVTAEQKLPELKEQRTLSNIMPEPDESLARK